MPATVERQVGGALRRLNRAGSILCFHSLSTPKYRSASAAHVSLEMLSFVVDVARSVGEIVPLRDLVERVRKGASTAGLCALTFDDAYAALFEAGEFLRERSVPVTIFVTSDAATAGSAYWWDRLEDLLPLVSPARWRRFEDACGVPEEYRRGQPIEYGPIRPLRQWILARFHGRWPAELGPVLDALEAETGFRTVQRSMNFEEIRRFCSRAPVHVGLHTRSHPVLALLPDAEVEQEVESCHAALREQLGDVAPILAIPFGLYDRRTAKLARQAGMVASLTVIGATLRNVRTPDLLPRFCLDRNERRWKLPLRLLGVAETLQRMAGRRVEEYPPVPSAVT